MIIGFSLGTIHKILNGEFGQEFFFPTINKDNWITWYRTRQKGIGNFNAMEIVMLPKQEEYFKLSEENYHWLKNLKYISYHLTQCTEDTEKVLKQLPFISSIVCHVDEKNILTYDFLKKYLNKICFENIEGKDYPFFKGTSIDKICFDFAHAMSINNSYVNDFYKKYEKQIKQIHLSYHDPILKHIPFHNKVHECFGFSIKIKHNCPIIIESAFNNIEEMKKELQFIKERI